MFKMLNTKKNNNLKVLGDQNFQPNNQIVIERGYMKEYKNREEVEEKYKWNLTEYYKYDD